jgi:aryl-alcohol dehydrogenase-like predicted oxidoreductase
MEQRRVGRTGLRVSRIGLGTMTWGRDTGEDDAAAQLTAFADAGGTLIDTADSYSGGDSEAITGRLLRTVVPRSEVVLAARSSVTPERSVSPGAPASGSPDGGPGSAARRGHNASRRDLLAALDASLARLGTDHVDVWQPGGWDDGTPLEETLSALDHAVSTGRARYAGVSNYAGWQLAWAAATQQNLPGRAPIAATEVEYSLVARGAEREVIPAAISLGVGVLCWSPLGRGVLTGKYRTGIPADSRAATPHLGDFVRLYLDDRCRAIVESVTTAAEGLGASPLAVALSWVRDRPGVAAVIAGARTTGQLTGILDGDEVTLPREIRAALDDVSAAPPGYAERRAEPAPSP